MKERFGEKTEQPTPRKLEEALKKGLFPRSAEVQTICVLIGGIVALTFAGEEMWRGLAVGMARLLGHLHEVPLTRTELPAYFLTGTIFFTKIVSPVVLAAMIGGLLAGAMQSRFRQQPKMTMNCWVAGLQSSHCFF